MGKDKVEGCMALRSCGLQGYNGCHIRRDQLTTAGTPRSWNRKLYTGKSYKGLQAPKFWWLCSDFCSVFQLFLDFFSGSRPHEPKFLWRIWRRVADPIPVAAATVSGRSNATKDFVKA